MYTVVFADDEIELRQAILQRIDWAGLGFSVVADAENGVEALEAVEQYEPDLLITDIRMPLMTGIELARRVREVCPATQIVFLSGYDDFGYAQEAIRYNVISYLLKPISAAELSEELGHIRAKMDARLEELRHAGANPQTEKRLAETEFLLPLLLGTSDDFERDEVLYARAAEIGLFETPPKRFCVAVAKFKGADGQNRTMARHIPLTETILSKYISVCVFLVNGRVVIFAYSDKDNSENFRIAMQDLVQSAAKLYSETCTVGISRLFTSISQSAAAYFEAVTARRYSTEGATPLRYITDQEHGSKNEYEYIEKSVFRLEELLKVGTEEALASFLEELYRESNQRSSDYLVIQILATVYRTVSTVSQKEALTALVADNPIYARVGLAERSETVRDELRRLCMDARKIISGYRTQSSQLLCDRAVAIIEADYADESLTLTDVSTRLAVSPNYLSALIKKNKGENLVSLLTACRMRHAYDLHRLLDDEDPRGGGALRLQRSALFQLLLQEALRHFAE